ncbi:MAG TPA: ribosome-binding factor A [Candidatus Paceibacterota bacterium]
MNHRPLRVSQLIRDELAKFILREMEFDGALVTVTEVGVDKKLTGAVVKVSVIPSEKSAEVLKELVVSQGKIQHELNFKLNIRPMPLLRFQIDHGAENAALVEKDLLSEK